VTLGKRLALILIGLALASASHAAIVAKEVEYRDGNTPLKGYLAYDDAMKDRRPGLLVVHEWWGLTRHPRELARELAAKGYTVLAADMYGKVAEDPKVAGELMNGVMGSPEIMKSRFEAAKNFLAAQPTVDPKRLGAVGFSMGGRVVLSMARMGDDLAGVVSVYGNLETNTPAKAGVTRSRVLVINAAGDPFVKPESIPAFKKEMEAAKVNYRFVEYPGVKHGFSNPDATKNGKKFDMPIAYNAAADRKSKEEMLKFFSEIFDKR
jgi:dienelactone hydrolase